ncbi:kinesin-like protein KIF11 isoform X2 [Bacillus rossius redtenbacheri]|uniref:kinesin-like protein KIF11 isoform X2 n=1 Tax=Bacillus rossius redtenbacheri TaxID=93214 RepID=UPI002FDCA60A
MGPACGVLGTAAVVALATLLVTLDRLAHKEYTEEIERLRREVFLSRETSGVFMSLENYTRMVNQMEQQEQELAGRTADIVALTKKMDAKEKMCHQLITKLERRAERPGDATNVTCDTAQRVDRSRPPAAERQMSDQPKTEVPVADAPHENTGIRLSRKRLAEKENDQIIRDFRMKFNQNMALLENSIQMFSQSYYKFNTGFQESLGSYLEKGVADMSTLSEKMSSLIDSHDEIVQGLERMSSEMVHTSQRMIQGHLRTARKAADLEAGKLHSHWTEVALPELQGLARSLQLQKGETASLKRLMSDQLEKHVSDQKELCARIKDNFLQFARQQSQRAEKLRNFLAVVHDEESAAAAEISSILHGVTLALEAKKSQSAKFLERVSRVGEEFSREDEASSKLSRVIAEDIDRQAKKNKEQLELYQDQSEEINISIDGIIDRSLACGSAAERHLRELETSVQGALSGGQAAWRDHYQQTEEHLRAHAEHLNAGLDARLQQTRLLTGTVHGTAEAHEAALEGQRLGLGDFVRGRQDAAEEQCSRVAEWSHAATSEVRRLDSDLERFIGEDLRMDLSRDPTSQGVHYRLSSVLSSREELLDEIRAYAHMIADEKAMEGPTHESISSINKAKVSQDYIRKLGKHKRGRQ